MHNDRHQELPGSSGAEAAAISDAGQVAGNSGQAFFWSGAGGMVG